ncbi:MAG: sigma-54-dependent Fis family transcriptional regulator [Magnetococcales bacterium]|nr:sigma-54-dependent Fis family transcriptional regulator [Magnetococcales bacterium]
MNHERAITMPVVLVDDETEVLNATSILLESRNISPIICLEDGRSLVNILNTHGGLVVVLDLVMPKVSGMELLKEIRNQFPEIPVIIMTALNTLDIAVECMKSGAFDYLVKPVEESRLIATIQKASEMRSLKEQLQRLQGYLTNDTLQNEEAFTPIITRSKKIRGIFQYLEAIAHSAEPVLIQGETGVGKELFANALHKVSNRKGKLIAFNVAGLDESTFSDTLFGHRKGAFTGADRTRQGLIAEAHDGTLFLDEIGDLDSVLQVKLLRLLQERQYFPIGSDLPRLSNARIVCATNRDLDQLTESGQFRSDLYYRLSAHKVTIPPLRSRKEDLPFLIHHFLDEAAQAQVKKRPTPPPALMTLLENYSFPGNIRELRGMIHDAVAQHRSHILSLQSFKRAIQRSHPGTTQTNAESPLTPPNVYQLFPDPLPSLDSANNDLIKEALRRAKGNQSLTASLLGISRQTLIRRMKKIK